MENTALEVIAKSNATDPDKDKITFLSGTGSELFKVDENGTVTLAGNLDFEAAKSYQLTLIADDGTNKASTAFTVNVGDVGSAISTKVAAASFAENISKGSTIATSSASDQESSSISYSLVAPAVKFFYQCR